jgi:hypothetical protein
MRLTLGDVRESRIPAVLGVCSDSARVVEFVNEATQRLLTKGHWWGSYARIRFCATDGCLTMPPQVAALERAAVCGSSVSVHDQWYEFLENGFGLRHELNGSSSDDSAGTSCNCGSFGMGEALQRGTFPTFADVQGTNKKLRVVCDLSGDAAKEILLLGYDENGNWIRTLQSGVIRDGEIVAMAQGNGTTSSNFFSVITDIQAPDDLDGQWWLYEYNNDDATLRMLGHYQYFERRPNYQRYFFPSIRSGSNSEGECSLTTVEAIVKLDFIPVKNDTDYLLIGNLPAVKEMARAIHLAENEPDGEKAERLIRSGYRLALNELDTELQHYLGDRKIGIDIVGPSVGSAQVIEALL